MIRGFAAAGVRRWGGLALAAALLAAESVGALERVSVPHTDDRSYDDWGVGGTCRVSYYNICTGWVWIWSGWSAGQTVGLVIPSCIPENQPGYLQATNVYAWSGAPSGYGFTGTVRISVADKSGCPGRILASTPLLPTTGSNTQHWNLLFPFGETWVLTYEHSSQTARPDPIIWATDHPAAGATGPAACGTVCYPPTRTTFSYLFGTEDEVLCPGSSLADDTCKVEWLGWGIGVFGVPIHVDSESWAKVKELYR